MPAGIPHALEAETPFRMLAHGRVSGLIGLLQIG
jgi:hypothetical protein